MTGIAGEKESLDRVKGLKSISFRLWGNYLKREREKYSKIRLQLRQARMPVSYELYVSDALFYSYIAGVIGGLVGLFIAYVVVVMVGLPPRITNLTFGPRTAWLLQYKEVSIFIFITLFFALILGGLTYLMFLVYPAYRAGERKRDIDRHLPYAVTFLYALSRGGMNILEVLKALSRNSDTYGEVAQETEVVLRDMEYFGNDLRTALQNICETTPSEHYRDLMHNLLSVIDSGGSISAYFRDKSEQYLREFRAEQKGFLETLGLIAESYVTAFVAGPLFIIILGVMMSVMGSGSDLIIYAVVYGIIPVGSLMFVVLLDILTPSSGGETPLIRIKRHRKPLAEPGPEEAEIYRRFLRAKRWLWWKNALKHPLQSMWERPITSLYRTVPIAFAYFLFSVYNGVQGVDTALIYSVLIVIVPLAIFHERKARRENKVHSHVPDFLQKLASTNETGMSLRESLRLIAREDIGYLSREVKRIWRDIEWGQSTNEALIRFANRVRSHLVSRSMTLLTRANESSGDIGEVLAVAARDAQAEYELKKERSMNMLIYVVIIYISFFIFIGIIYIISTTFLSEMAKAGVKVSATSTTGIPLRGFNPQTLETYNRLFFHAAEIQGLFSGLIAGAMGEGKVLSGLKHSVIMITTAYLLFTLFVL